MRAAVLRGDAGSVSAADTASVSPVPIKTVLSQGLLPVLIGAALGLAAAVAVSRVMASLLFEVSPYDPATYAAVVATVATLACYLPARRVLRVDPATALRVE